jgi:hypothetical protein
MPRGLRWLGLIMLAWLDAEEAHAAIVDCMPSAGLTACKRFTYSGGDQSFTVPTRHHQHTSPGLGRGGAKGYVSKVN